MSGVMAAMRRGSIAASLFCFFFSLVTACYIALEIYMLRAGKIGSGPTRYVGLVVEVVVCVGLALKRKWAALVFAGTGAVVAAALVAGSIQSVLWPYRWYNFRLSLVLLLPVAIVIFYWPALRWRGKLGV